MIGEIAERVKNLSLRDVESLCGLKDRLPALTEHNNLAYGDTQTIDNGFAATNAFLANDMRMLRLDSFRQELFSSVYCFRTTRIFTAYLPGNSLPDCSGRMAMPKCNRPVLSAVKE